MYCHEFNELTEKIENMSFDKQFKIAEGLRIEEMVFFPLL